MNFSETILIIFSPEFLNAKKVHNIVDVFYDRLECIYAVEEGTIKLFMRMTSQTCFNFKAWQWKNINYSLLYVVFCFFCFSLKIKTNSFFCLFFFHFCQVMDFFNWFCKETFLIFLYYVIFNVFFVKCYKSFFSQFSAVIF